MLLGKHGFAARQQYHLHGVGGEIVRYNGERFVQHAARMDELEAALGSDMTDVDEVIEALRLDCNTADALLRADFGAADETLANRISALEAASEAADIALNAAIEEVRQRLENVKTELEEENAALSDRLEAEINENGTFRDSVLKLVPVFIAISCAVLVLVLIIVACAVRSVKKAARSKSIIKRRD